jgi:alanyl-tRNA synthetase
MKREELKALGLDDAAIDSIMAIHGKDIEVNKTKVTQLEDQVKTLNTSIQERDTQLEGLKKSSGDVESLKTQIASLQETNTKQAQEAADKLKEIQVNNAIKIALNGKVHDADLVAGLFDKTKLVVNDDGSVIGLDDQVKSLQGTKAFLFKTEEGGGNGKPGFQIGNPGNPNNNPSAADAAIAAAFGNTQTK